ncbi:cell division protein FtsQ [Riemerella anatipestifer]|nr:cell division protein FtsQ [Riemerella anatipestifer]MDY3345404.1 cell division protein FtsQ [Riemerella anatipestifer]MDY3358484.1 cell division protein FtsQ [Riemerella anatipestifer]
MKNKYRILKIAVTIILLGFLLNFSLKRFNNTSMDKVAVNIIQGEKPVYFIDEKEIESIVKKANTTNRVGDIDIPKLERKIAEYSAVDSANVYLSLDGILHLDIVQRVPVFRLSKGKKEVYVDEKGVEFPINRNYSASCMLVSGNVQPEEYPQLIELVKKINQDDFSKKFFIGIVKERENYYLIANEENYRVELGSLENIDFKVKGFKAFVEKYLVYQPSDKYTKISLKYDNQIVTTLSKGYKEETDKEEEKNK